MSSRQFCFLLKRSRIPILLCVFIYVLIHILSEHESQHGVRNKRAASAREDLSELGSNSEKVSKLLIMGHQRCGASLVSESFNQHPEVFSAFEPIDGSYRHIYATSNGWNVPSDIFYLRNGTHRNLPQKEIDTVSQTLLGFFQCNISLIPVETLTHSFISYWIPKDYTKCIKSLKKARGSECRLKHLCPSRLGRSMEKSENCGDALQGVRALGVNKQGSRTSSALESALDHTVMLNKYKYSREFIYSSFQNYSRCMSEVSRHAKSCVTEFESICSSARIRSVKTVRATVASVAEVLRRDPDVHVLQVFRDPRAVAWSRLRQNSFRGIWSRDDMTREAALYCDQALRDLKLTCNLSTMYPGNFHKIVFENYSRNLTDEAQKLYKSLGIQMPEDVERWLIQNTHDAKDFSPWTMALSFKTAKQIADICEPLANALDNPWDF